MSHSTASGFELLDEGLGLATPSTAPTSGMEWLAYIAGASGAASAITGYLNSGVPTQLGAYPCFFRPYSVDGTVVGWTDSAALGPWFYSFHPGFQPYDLLSPGQVITGHPPVPRRYWGTTGLYPDENYYSVSSADVFGFPVYDADACQILLDLVSEWENPGGPTHDVVLVGAIPLAFLGSLTAYVPTITRGFGSTPWSPITTVTHLPDTGLSQFILRVLNPTITGSGWQRMQITATTSSAAAGYQWWVCNEADVTALLAGTDPTGSLGDPLTTPYLAWTRSFTAAANHQYQMFFTLQHWFTTPAVTTQRAKVGQI